MIKYRIESASDFCDHNGVYAYTGCWWDGFELIALEHDDDIVYFEEHEAIEQFGKACMFLCRTVSIEWPYKDYSLSLIKYEENDFWIHETVMFTTVWKSQIR